MIEHEANFARLRSGLHKWLEVIEKALVVYQLPFWDP
jgi:hypothetical protein